MALKNIKHFSFFAFKLATWVLIPIFIFFYFSPQSYAENISNISNCSNGNCLKNPSDIVISNDGSTILILDSSNSPYLRRINYSADGFNDSTIFNLNLTNTNNSQMKAGLSPNNKQAFVYKKALASEESPIQLINLENSAISTLNPELYEKGQVSTVAYASGDSKKLLVSNNDVMSAKLFLINLETNTIEKTTSLKDIPKSLDISPDFKKAIITYKNLYSNSVSIYEIETGDLTTLDTPSNLFFSIDELITRNSFDLLSNFCPISILSGKHTLSYLDLKNKKMSIKILDETLNGSSYNSITPDGRTAIVAGTISDGSNNIKLYKIIKLSSETPKVDQETLVKNVGIIIDLDISPDQNKILLLTVKNKRKVLKIFRLKDLSQLCEVNISNTTNGSLTIEPYGRYGFITNPITSNISTDSSSVSILNNLNLGPVLKKITPQSLPNTGGIEFEIDGYINLNRYTKDVKICFRNNELCATSVSVSDDGKKITGFTPSLQSTTLEDLIIIATPKNNSSNPKPRVNESEIDTYYPDSAPPDDLLKSESLENQLILPVSFDNVYNSSNYKLEPFNTDGILPKNEIEENTKLQVSNTVYDPIGSLDSTSCTEVKGWSCDRDRYNYPLIIYIYVDGPLGRGRLIGLPQTNLPSNTTVNSQCGNTPNHGFSFKIPSYLIDGKEHQIYAYARNISRGSTSLKLLTNSPQKITCGLNSTNNSQVSLNSVAINPDNTVGVNYSKNFSDCVQLKDSNNNILHTSNLFCTNNGPITTKVSSFNSNFQSGKQVKLCHINNPNICSSLVTISGTITPEIITLNKCENLNLAGKTYKLSQDIISTTSSNCLNINANNITIDCDGKSISGNGNGIGVFSNSTQNWILKNCNIKNFSKGIELGYGSHFSSIENNNISNNNQYGIHCPVHSYDVSLKNNKYLIINPTVSSGLIIVTALKFPPMNLFKITVPALTGVTTATILLSLKINPLVIKAVATPSTLLSPVSPLVKISLTTIKLMFVVLASRLTPGSANPTKLLLLLTHALVLLELLPRVWGEFVFVLMTINFIPLVVVKISLSLLIKLISLIIKFPLTTLKTSLTALTSKTIRTMF